MNVRVNVWACTFLVLAILALGSRTEAHAAAFYVDQGFVHGAEDRGAGEGGLRLVRVEREDGRAFDAAVGEDAIVQLHEGVEAREAFARFGLRAELLSLGARLYQVRSAAFAGDAIGLAERLSFADAGEYFSMAVPDYHLEHKPAAIDVPPDDPRYGGQWFLKRMSIEEAWMYSTGSATVSIAVLDTGCDLTHPDLVGKLDPGRDEVDRDDDPTYRADQSGAEHGTACAGLIAADTNNGIGVAGACPECRLRCIRLIDNPVPLSADILAFEFAKNAGVAVLSNSWGYSGPVPTPGPLKAEIAEVTENGRNGLGAIVVFAAGNENRELIPDELVSLPNVISVGALTVFDETTSFSNFGATLDVVAPLGTLTTDISGAGGGDPTDYTGNFGGTSSACPLVAGIAGLLVAAKPDATAREIEVAIIETTRPSPFAVPGPDGHDPHYGYGIVDPGHAMRRLLGIPEPEPDAGVADAGETPPPADAAVPTDTGLSNSVEPTEETGCSCSSAAHRGELSLISALFVLALIARFSRHDRTR